MVFMASSLGEKIWHGPAQEEQRVEIPKGIGPIDDNRQARITGDRSQSNPNRGGFEDCGLSQCTHPILGSIPRGHCPHASRIGGGAGTDGAGGPVQPNVAIMEEVVEAL